MREFEIEVELKAPNYDHAVFQAIKEAEKVCSDHEDQDGEEFIWVDTIYFKTMRVHPEDRKHDARFVYVFTVRTRN